MDDSGVYCGVGGSSGAACASASVHLAEGLAPRLPCVFHGAFAAAMRSTNLQQWYCQLQVSWRSRPSNGTNRWRERPSNGPMFLSKCSRRSWNLCSCGFRVHRKQTCRSGGSVPAAPKRLRFSSARGPRIFLFTDGDRTRRKEKGRNRRASLTLSVGVITLRMRVEAQHDRELSSINSNVCRLSKRLILKASDSVLQRLWIPYRIEVLGICQFSTVPPRLNIGILLKTRKGGNFK